MGFTYFFVESLGFIPRIHARFGQRYAVQATEGIAEFERQQLLDKSAMNQLIKVGKLQDGKWEPSTLEDKTVNILLRTLPDHF